MSEWTKKTYRLEGNHRWKAAPGNVIFVANRGEVQFEYPSEWIIEPGETFKLRDRQPPDDTCTLQVSILRLAGEIDWSLLPTADQLLVESLGGSNQDLIWRGPVQRERRAEMELAWVESHAIDPGEHRLAISRTCLASGGLVQVLLTLDFWPEDQVRLHPVWSQLIRTLEVRNAAF